MGLPSRWRSNDRSRAHAGAQRTAALLHFFIALTLAAAGCAESVDTATKSDGSVVSDSGADAALVGDASLDGALVGDAGPDASADGSTVDPLAWWRTERASRQAALDAYLAANDDGLRALLYGPLGTFGIPRVTLENFSTVMPDRWGPPEEKFAATGLGADLHDPTNTLPLGLAAFQWNGAEVVNITCGACHVGRIIGPDGLERLLFGAPNTRFNTIFTAFEDTAADPRWSTLPGGAGAATIGQALQLRRQVENRTIGGFTFDPTSHPGAPDPFAHDQPGYFDSFAMIFAMQTLPEALLPLTDATLASIMPPAPGESDIMSLWMQSARPAAEWDGSLPHPVYRNLAASVGAMGFGSAVNYDTSATVARFSSELPSPPYPFDVDGPAAARGSALFTRYCQGCHHDGASAIFSPGVTGTDPNRAHSVTVDGRTRLIKALRSACTDATVCNVSDSEIVIDVSNGAALGYMAIPLRGIWARAPYLHNGSVPTLRQLLVPSSRPSSFYRGSLHYDTKNVGFSWDASAADDPYVHPYDTTRLGRSNAGHSSPMFLGIDWASHPGELADLLEYLKTL